MCIRDSIKSLTQKIESLLFIDDSTSNESLKLISTTSLSSDRYLSKLYLESKIHNIIASLSPLKLRIFNSQLSFSLLPIEYPSSNNSLLF